MDKQILKIFHSSSSNFKLLYATHTSRMITECDYFVLKVSEREKKSIFTKKFPGNILRVHNTTAEAENGED